MNKTLLFLSALALCGSSMLAQSFEFVTLPKSVPAQVQVQARADENATSMEFRYYQSGEVDGLSANGLTSGEIWEAVGMPKETAANFAGNKITSLIITTPPNARTTSNANYVRDITIFLSNSRTGTPFYSQTASLPVTASTQAEVTLDTPYEISGDDEIWFGYYFTLTRNIVNNQLYVAIDNVPTDDKNGAWVKLAGQWQSVEGYGSLLIGAMVEGDKLPQNMGSLKGIDGKDWVAQNDTYTFGAVIKNQAANDITSAEIEYTFNGGEAVKVSKTLDVPVAANGTGLVEAEFTCDVAGSQLPLTVKLTKVNGVDVEAAPLTKYIDSYKPGTIFKQNVLLEEGTGNWCSWCPMGIVMLESIKEKYTDGSAILVGVHSKGAAGIDPMETTSYGSFISWAYTGFPSYVVNRKYSMGFYQSSELNLQNFEAVYNDVTSSPAKGKIDLYLEWTSDDRTSIHAETQSIFALPSTGTYKVAFIVVEDGVINDKTGKQYNQSNALTGTPGFGVFSTGGGSIPWTYDDVARDIFSAFGLANSAITDPEEMTPYNYEYEVSLANVSKVENARIVAALLDNDTREVINAVEVPLSQAAGVGNIAADAVQVSVRAEMGAVVVNGAAVTEVYTVDGRRAATAYGEATINLPAGMYIVKADKLVKKVVVK